MHYVHTAHSRIAELALSMYVKLSVCVSECVCERENTFHFILFFSVVFVAHFDALMTGVGGSYIKHCGFPICKHL